MQVVIHLPEIHFVQTAEIYKACVKNMICSFSFVLPTCLVL